MQLDNRTFTSELKVQRKTANFADILILYHDGSSQLVTALLVVNIIIFKDTNCASLLRIDLFY